jgi:hypothetical protein
MAMNTPRYLFVNKTPSSHGSATSESEDRKLINRHTQLHGLAARNFAKANLAGKKSSSGVSNSRLDSSSRRKTRSPESSEGKRQGGHAFIRESQINGVQKSLPLFFLGTQSPKAKQEAHALLERVLFTVRVMSDGQKIQDQDSNPVQSHLLSLDAHICQYLQKYPYSNQEKTMMSGGYTELQNEQLLLDTAISMLEGGLDNDLLMYALLANMSTIVSEQKSRISQYHSKYYCYQATAALRRRLSTSTSPDASLVLSLWHLISAEMNQGNFEAATIHLKGAVAICDLMCIDDPNYVGPFQICDTLLATDIFKQHLDVSHLLFDPGPCSNFHDLNLGQAVCGSSVPNNLLSSKHRSFVSPELRKTIEELIEYNLSAAARSHSQEEWRTSIHDGYWSRLSWRFLTLRETNCPSSLLARGISMWIYLMLYTLSDIKIAQPVSYSLQKSLSSASPQEWAGHEEVLIWMLTVGAMVPMGARAEQTWYARKLVALLDESSFGKDYDFTRKNDIVVFSKRYFWIDDIQKPILESLVEIIKSVRLETNILKPYREARFFSSYTGEASGKGKWHKLSDVQNSKKN